MYLAMHLHRCVKLLLTTIFIQGTCPEGIPGKQTNYLDSFRFIPVPGDCYQLYHRHDLISSCWREPDIENQSCVQWVSNGHECLGLVTPTNETVIFRCSSDTSFDKCFVVYDTNKKGSIICQEIFQGRGVGITTPDNFTILVHDSFCRTATNAMERQTYVDFVNNFSLDPEARSCYKVYSSKEVVTPYNCLSKTIHNSCVFSMTGGCTALMTQNNEVLVLDCPDQGQKPSKQNCFYLYTPDNQIHTVCQKKVEERCIGVVTPSNLTVLFECFFCSESMEYIYYNYERQKKFRWFVKSYLENEYTGRNSRLFNHPYKVFNNNLESPNSLVTYSYWIPKTSCLGITLESNETILLECMVLKEKQEQPGCFQLNTAENERQSVCTEILNEACVGLKTSKNLSVALACYNTAENYKSVDNRPEWHFILEALRDFVDNKHVFYVGDYFEAYKDGDNQRETIQYQVQQLADQPDCIGILTETEIIVLNCSHRKVEQNGCFNVTKLEHDVNHEVSDPNGQVENICVKALDSECVGIITSDNWILPYMCFSYMADGPFESYESNNYLIKPDMDAMETPGYISNLPSNMPNRVRRNLQWKNVKPVKIKL